LLARVESLQSVLLAIEIHLENDDLGELRPRGERVENLVLGLTGRTPRSGDIDKDRLVAALGSLEGTGVVLSLLECVRRRNAQDGDAECEQGSVGTGSDAHEVLR
jgi:hypothetical protein